MLRSRVSRGPGISWTLIPSLSAIESCLMLAWLLPVRISITLLSWCTWTPHLYANQYSTCQSPGCQSASHLSGPPRQVVESSTQLLTCNDSDHRYVDWAGDNESNELDGGIDNIREETDSTGAAALNTAQYVHLCDKYKQSAAALAVQKSGGTADTLDVSQLFN